VTDEMMNFPQAVGKNPGADLLREMSGFRVQGLMAMGATGHVNSGDNPGQRRGVGIGDLPVLEGALLWAGPRSLVESSPSNRAQPKLQ
jgi:hypothetical protein